MSRSLNTSILLLLAALIAIGCSFEDQDYKTGRYYLDEKENWQLASQFFRKSLDAHPDRWKTHLGMIEALSRGDDSAKLEIQLRETFRQFPDSVKSVAISGFATTLIGDEAYNRIAGRLALQELTRQIDVGTKDPSLLARAIAASCRAGDTLSTLEYLSSYLQLGDASSLPGDVRMELDFFLGPSRVERETLLFRLAKEPSNASLLLDLAKASLLSHDPVSARDAIKRAAQAQSDLTEDARIKRMFGALFGIQPFTGRDLARGSDGTLHPTGGGVITIRNLGKPREPDIYFYLNETPVMKAGQQDIWQIARPRFSDDGVWIYFFGSTEKFWKFGSSGRFQIYRVKPIYGAKPEKLTNEDLIPIEFHLERSGRILALRSDAGSHKGSSEVIRIDPAKRTATTVVRIGEPTYSGCFTPDGDTLVFTSARGVLKRSLQGGAIKVELPLTGFAHPAISPNGRWLVLHSPEGGEFLFDRREGGFTYLGKSPTPSVFFKNDGKLIVTRGEDGREALVEIDLDSPAPGSGLAGKLNKPIGSEE